MAIINVLKYGNSVLSKMSEEVKKFDSKLKDTINDMTDTLYKFNGIGLAAVQIGKPYRIIVIDTSRYENGSKIIIVNPKILTKSLITAVNNEGCLSLPGLFADVERNSQIELEGYTANGKPLRMKAKDMVARVIQHEIDHLDGILFINRLNKTDKKKLDKEWKRIQKETL